MQTCGMMFIMLLNLLSGCLFVWEEDEFYPRVALSAKPEIAMSDVFIQSKEGDMLAFIPRHWTKLGTDKHPSKDVIGIAVDSSLTLSMVLSTINHSSGKTLAGETDVNELMRNAIMRHKERSGGLVKQIGKGRPLSIGRRTFGLIEFSGTDGLNTKALVWQSQSGNHYECALVPLDIMGASIPEDSVKSRIIRSIAAMIMF